MTTSEIKSELQSKIASLKSKQAMLNESDPIDGKPIINTLEGELSNSTMLSDFVNDMQALADKI